VTGTEGADVLALVDAALTEHFGQRPIRSSVTFVGVEPIEVLRFEPIPGEHLYATLGMSRVPMTPAEASRIDADGPRAELLLHVRAAPTTLAGMWRSLAVLAAAPVVEGMVYSAGATVDLGRPLALGSQCVGGVIGRSAVADVATPHGTVALLQLHPATATELAWARVNGGAALLERWRRGGVDLLDLTRPAVPLGEPSADQSGS
jgi:hypothetical protein